jgi:hypothetical protein
MKYVAPICFLLVFLVAFTGVPDFKIREKPVMNLPYAMRQKNWLGNRMQGSCAHASWMSLLRWQRQYAAADAWGRKYGNGAYYSQFAAAIDTEGLAWAGTYKQDDVAFLEWACRTRRGCMVTCRGGSHMICLIDLDWQYATVLDNNATDVYKKIPRADFLAEWFDSYSWAMTPVYTPAPPLEAT